MKDKFDKIANIVMKKYYKVKQNEQRTPEFNGANGANKHINQDK